MRLPLIAKLVSLITLGLSVSVAITLYAVSGYLEQKLLAEQMENLRAKVVTTQAILEHLWGRGDIGGVRKTMAMLMTDPRMETALFVDQHMRVMATGNGRQEGKFLQQAVSEVRFELIRDAVGALGNTHKLRLWPREDRAGFYGVSLVAFGGGPGHENRDNDQGALFVAARGYSLADLPAILLKKSLPYLALTAGFLVFLGWYFYRVYIVRVKHIKADVKSFFEKGLVEGSVFAGKDELSDLGNSVTDLIQRAAWQHDRITSKETELKKILDSLGEGVIAYDLKGNIISLNRAATALTGWTQQEALGLPVTRVFHVVSEATGVVLDMSVQEQLLHDGNISIQGAMLVSRTGHRLNIACSIFPMLAASGELRGTVLVFRNITETREARRILDEIARGVTTDPSTTFFDNLAFNLYRLFRVKYVLIGLIDRDDPDSVTTRVFCENGRIGENFNYRLPGTPCEQTTVRDICFFPDRLSELFPEDEWLAENRVVSYMGALVRSVKGERVAIISLMHDQPLGGLQYFEETLSIFASRVAAEIERSMAYQKLEQAQKRLVQHVDATPVGVIEWNRDFRITAWNPSAERMFGYSCREALGQGFDIIVPPELKAYVDNIWHNLKTGRGGERSTNENIDKYGNRLLCDWYNTPLFDDNGEFAGLASIIMDVSRERKALQEVVKKENEQREILESMVDGVVTINENGTVLSFNSAAEKLFGYPADEIIGNKVNLLMTRQDKGHHDQYLQRFYETGDNHVIGDGREVLGRRKDGSTFPFRLAVSELPKDSDGRRRFIGCCQDLTLQKRQEEQIRRTQKMESLGKLTSGVAHDFNNILGIASGYANLLNNHLAEDPKLARYSREISKACERGSKLTKRMLAFSRDQFQQLSMVDINRLLSDERELLEKSLTPSIQLQLELTPDLWAASLDASDFMDAVINLVINALHAVNGPGKVTITTANKRVINEDARALDLADGDYVAVTVTDTGGGIPEEIKARIFDPFFTTKKEQGTGLGLSQVYGFAKRSGGGVDVASVAGEGASFTLYFPRCDTKDATTTELRQEVESETGGTETILVVDDEAAIRDIVNELLSGAGYRVLLAADAEAALVLLENHRVVLLFSDIVLPGMDGFDLASLVAKKYPAIKIQLATGSMYRERPLDERGKSLQYDVMRKPYQGDFLLRRIRHILDDPD